eukprot:9484108-Pyramimonas_sp.AAC.1
MVFGIPPPRASLPTTDSIQSECFCWGDADGIWGPVSYTDGSGYGSNHPEVRRCGWSVVQLDEETLLPKRAKYGPL